MEIKKTSDYSLFKITKLNRQIEQKHVDEFEQEANESPHLMEVCPILVNSEMEIIDGQHRFFACKKVGLPISYIQDNRLTAKDIITLNKSQKNWSLENYIFHHFNSGNENFSKLVAFSKKTSISYSLCCVFLGFNRKTLVRDIKMGYLNFPNDQIVERAEKKIQLCKNFQKAISLLSLDLHYIKNVFSYTFQESVANLEPEVNLDSFYENLLKNYDKIQFSRGWTNYHFQYKALGMI